MADKPLYASQDPAYAPAPGYGYPPQQPPPPAGYGYGAPPPPAGGGGGVYYQPVPAQPVAGEPVYGVPAGAPQMMLPATPAPGGHPIGMGGLPIAMPWFGIPSHDTIRHGDSCCDIKPGPHIPLHWFAAGNGWATFGFAAVAPYNPATYEPGRYRCQVPNGAGGHCGHEVVEKDCCKGNCCWSAGGTAPAAMAQHLASRHGLRPPPRRQWTTELFDCGFGDFMDSWCCAPCQGGRQMSALAGWPDTLNVPYCLFFTFLGFRVVHHGGRATIVWVPPHCYVALFVRPRVVALQNIEEHCCATLASIVCCPVCSNAQTHRELTAAGVWPGGMFVDPPSASRAPVVVAKMS